MAKTDLTITLERQIWRATCKTGIFGCFEVTIGWFGKERVDYMTYDTKGTWRCYEIKASKSDFYSKAKITFIGHYNYYVMTDELYKQVKDDIPKAVGVYIAGDGIREAYSVKKAKRQELGEDVEVLKDSLIRSLYRDAAKVYNSEDPMLVTHLARAKRDTQKWRDMYYDAKNEVWKMRYEMKHAKLDLDKEENKEGSV